MVNPVLKWSVLSTDEADKTFFDKWLCLQVRGVIVTFLVGCLNISVSFEPENLRSPFSANRFSLTVVMARAHEN